MLWLHNSADPGDGLVHDSLVVQLPRYEIITSFGGDPVLSQAFNSYHTHHHFVCDTEYTLQSHLFKHVYGIFARGFDLYPQEARLTQAMLRLCLGHYDPAGLQKCKSKQCRFWKQPSPWPVERTLPEQTAVCLAMNACSHEFEY